MTKNWKKITAEKKLNFFLNQKLQFTYPKASIKNVQVTEEAFSSQKKPSNTSKHELINFFLLLWVIFALLDPDPLTRINPDPIRIRIRIRNPAFYLVSCFIREKFINFNKFIVKCEWKNCYMKEIKYIILYLVPVPEP